MLSLLFELKICIELCKLLVPVSFVEAHQFIQLFQTDRTQMMRLPVVFVETSGSVHEASKVYAVVEAKKVQQLMNSNLTTRCLQLFCPMPFIWHCGNVVLGMPQRVRETEAWVILLG